MLLIPLAYGAAVILCCCPPDGAPNYDAFETTLPVGAFDTVNVVVGSPLVVTKTRKPQHADRRHATRRLTFRVMR